MSDDRTAALRADLSVLQDLGNRIVKSATAGGATVAECVLRTGSELSVTVRLGETELVEDAGFRGAGLRVMKGNRVASTSTSDLTEGGIARFVEDALEILELSQEDPFAGPVDPKLLCDPKSLPDLELYDPRGGDLTAAQAIAEAARGEAAARAFDPRITNSDGATMGRNAGGSVIVLSSGFTATTIGSYQSLSVVPLAEDEGGKKRRGYFWTAKRFMADLEDAAKVGEEAARRTLRKLGARTIPTGKYPVIFDPDAARSMVGTFAGTAMGGSIWRKSSWLCDREKTRVASDLVTLVDDPFLLRGPGSRAFDGEGVASRKNVVVENGVLEMYLCDSYAARKLNRETTASAARGGGGGVGASTTNFFLKAGADSPEAILKGTKRGLYVTEMMGFGFNAITGDFSRGAAGFWIENGELAYPVSEVTISLNFKDLWQRVDAVGSDLRFDSSTASPTFRVSEMTIAGGTGADE